MRDTCDALPRCRRWRGTWGLTSPDFCVPWINTIVALPTESTRNLERAATTIIATWARRGIVPIRVLGHCASRRFTQLRFLPVISARRAGLEQMNYLA